MRVKAPRLERRVLMTGKAYRHTCPQAWCTSIMGKAVRRARQFSRLTDRLSQDVTNEKRAVISRIFFSRQ